MPAPINPIIPPWAMRAIAERNEPDSIEDNQAGDYSDAWITLILSAVYLSHWAGLIP